MDIVARATLGFFFVLFVTRIVGRRELSSMQPFDLILLVMIGDLVQQGMTQNDFSVTGLVLAAGTIAVAHGRRLVRGLQASRGCGRCSTGSR